MSAHSFDHGVRKLIPITLLAFRSGSNQSFVIGKNQLFIKSNKSKGTNIKIF